jgi:hypothetical protein
VTVSYAEMVECVKREIGMRRRVYPRWVEAGKMRQSKADDEIRVMEAVFAALCDLEEKERLL